MQKGRRRIFPWCRGLVFADAPVLCPPVHKQSLPRLAVFFDVAFSWPFAFKKNIESVSDNNRNRLQVGRNLKKVQFLSSWSKGLSANIMDRPLVTGKENIGIISGCLQAAVVGVGHYGYTVYVSDLCPKEVPEISRNIALFLIPGCSLVCG